MVSLSVSDATLTLDVRGAERLWALKSSLEIPLQHIGGIRADPTIARVWRHGFRMRGTNIPRAVTAATFYHYGKLVFWDVQNPDKRL